MLQDQANEISMHMSEARTDALTNLPNRRAFDEELKRRMAEWRRHQVPLSVLIMDIDRFKRLNDAYGHPAGDVVLAGVAEALQKTMRESDIVARIGGEELAVILPSSNAVEARRAAVRARVAVEQTQHSYEGQLLQVTISVGVAQLSADESQESLLRRADEAMYVAKEAGRNLAYWHDGQQCLPAEPSRGGHLKPLAQKATQPVDPRPHDFVQVCADLRRRLEEVVRP